MPWWRRPVLFSVALQLSVEFCAVKVEWSAEIKEEKCCLLQLHAYVHVCICLCVWICVCTGTYAYIYMGVWVRLCLMLLLLQFVEGLSWFGVYFIGGLLVCFFFSSLSHAFNSSKFLEQPVCQGKAKYKSESWHHSCIWVLIPRRKSFPVGLAQYRRAPGLPGFANPGESAPAMWRKPLKSKLRVPFFG